MWTNRPQKRCSGADFARVSILSRSSCRLMSVFNIPTYLSSCSRVPLAGPLRFPGVNLLDASTDPSAKPCVFVALYLSARATTLLQRFRCGTQASSLFLNLVLVCMLSPLPRQRSTPVSSRFRTQLLPSPCKRRFGLWVFKLTRPLLVFICCYGLHTRSPCRTRLCRWPSRNGLPLLAPHPSYAASTFYRDETLTQWNMVASRHNVYRIINMCQWVLD